MEAQGHALGLPDAVCLQWMLCHCSNDAFLPLRLMRMAVKMTGQLVCSRRCGPTNHPAALAHKLPCPGNHTCVVVTTKSMQPELRSGATYGPMRPTCCAWRALGCAHACSVAWQQLFQQVSHPHLTLHCVHVVVYARTSMVQGSVMLGCHPRGRRPLQWGSPPCSLTVRAP